jgi:maltokinase
VTSPLPTPPDRVLERALAAWLPGRRWFAAKDRPFGRPRIVHRLAYPHTAGQQPWRLELLVVEVMPSQVDPPHHYLVPIATRAASAALPAPHAIARFGDCVVHDALADPDVVRHLVHGMLAGDAGHPRLAVRREEIPPPAASGAGTVRMLPGEQSNTSVIVDGTVIAKFFRRLRTGENPEAELLRLLTRAGEPHVPGLLASLSGPAGNLRGGTATYAVLQRFLPAARNGWDLALADARALAGATDAGLGLGVGMRGDTASAGFAWEAHRMGRAVAEVHRSLAAATAPTVLTRSDLHGISTRMRERLATAVRTVPELRSLAPPVAAAYQNLADSAPGVAAQRVHGDLHLGQVLKAGMRWSVIDFEGEPDRTFEERRTPHPAAKDIAGMLRSFDYAEHHVLIGEGKAPAPADVQQRLHDWAQRNQDAFCAGYAQGAGTDPRDHPVLLRTYLMDKAVYEVLYETRNRPAWVPIPLRALQRLVREGTAQRRT